MYITIERPLSGASYELNTNKRSRAGFEGTGLSRGLAERAEGCCQIRHRKRTCGGRRSPCVPKCPPCGWHGQ